LGEYCQSGFSHMVAEMGACPDCGASVEHEGGCIAVSRGADKRKAQGA